MQHQPAPTATDIELMLTRPKPALTVRPLDLTPAPVDAAPHYTPVERATIRRRWLAHFAALVEYGALWVIILSSLVVLVA